jgi:hypothetical protein
VKVGRYRFVDGAMALQYTRAVRRVLAAVTVVSLAALQSQALAFHVHAVPDHVDGIESRHHHGPAIHHHQDDVDVHVDSGDATVGRVIAVTIPAAVDSVPSAIGAELVAVVLGPQLEPVGKTFAIYARSHDPPTRSLTLYRGPPLPSPL